MQSTFDTLTALREIEAAGVEDRRADAIAGPLCRAARAGLARLTTTTDLYPLAFAIVAANAAITLRSARGTVNSR